MSKVLQTAHAGLSTAMPVIIFACSLLQGIAEQNAYTALKGLGIAVLFAVCLWGVKK